MYLAAVEAGETREEHSRAERNIIRRLSKSMHRGGGGVKSAKKVAKGNISLHYVFFAAQCRLKMTHILLHPDTGSSCRKSLSLP
jgi:hypothetical protein